MRRAATEALQHSILKKSKRKAAYQIEQQKQSPIIKTKKLNVLVSTREQFDVVSKDRRVNILYCELTEDFKKNYLRYIEVCHKNNIKLYAAFPRIQRSESKEIDILKESNIDGFLVRSPGQFKMVSKTGKEITIDYSMNVLNQESVSFWLKQGANNVCVSVENNLQEINAIANKNYEMVVYGYLPLMITQQCPIGNYAGGKTNGIF